MGESHQPPASSAAAAGLARLLAQLPAVVWTTDRDLSVTFAAGAGLRDLGLETRDVIGRTVRGLYRSDEAAEESLAAHRRALSGESTSCEMAYEGRVYETRILPLLDESGAISGCLGLGVDVTSRKRALEALGSSEAHYRTLFERAPIGMYRSSLAGRFLTVNPALVEMLGYQTVDEVLALDLARDVYVDPGQRVLLMERYRSADHIAGVEVAWRRKDGSPITVRLSGHPVRDAEGGIVCWEMAAQDETERHRLEARLRTAEKMEALGLVTGGVAHDFNNLLTTIIANAELVAGTLPLEMRELRTDLLEIRNAAARGTDLVKKLLGFGRRERLTMQPTDVGALVEEMIPVVRRLVPERIEVTHLAEPAVPPVMADTGALQQILLALASNARDAIAARGRVHIEVRRARLEAAQLADYDWGSPGEYVAVAVRDDGHGMDEATRSHVFEPFFTTKPVGGGVGLGLAMVYGLMKQQNGFVEVASQPGSGTTVTLLLPVTTAGTGDSPRQPSASGPRGAGTVLLVEDEDQIRRVAKRVLERHAYKVVTAADGLEALELFREHEAAIGLVITDAVMPRMGGRELYEKLRAAGKQVPVIFTSGYAARESAETEGLDPRVPYLAKPWTVEELLAKVREVVGP